MRGFDRLAVFSLVVLATCVDSGPGPQGKKVDATYVQAHLLANIPTDIERFDLALDGVTYLGNKVEKTRVPPGQPVTVSHYWKVSDKTDKPVGDRWRMFAQLRGAPGTADFMNLSPTDMQQGHGPATWQPGEIIEDIQVINLRPDWRSNEATLLIGMIEVGKHGTLDRMPVTGPRTIDNAIIAHKFEIDLARAPAPKGSLYIPQANGVINVDGVSSDPGWLGVQPAELVAAEGSSGEPIGKAIAKMTWNAEFLYVFVSVTDSDITTPYTNQDDPLWKADCVELFIDADSNRQGYVELQVNPNNATFDSWFATTRAKPGDVEWDSGMVTAVKLRGSTAAGDSGDTGWDVEIAIPWAAVKGKNDDMKVRLPPEVGDRWRLNLVRVDRKTGGKDNEMWASSWNRISMADFHALDRMLTAVFADRTGSIVPQAKDPNAGSGSAGTGSAGSGNAGSGSGSNVTAALMLPTSVTAAMITAQDGLEIEVLPAGTRFAGVTLDDAQLDALLKLAVTRDKTVRVKLRPARGVQPVRSNAVVDRVKAVGIANVTLAPEGVGNGSAEAAGSGSARPAAGSGSARLTPNAPGPGTVRTGSGSGTRP